MNLLDPQLYAGVRRPPLEAETLPPWCYHSEDFYQLELRHIFRRKWLLMGRVEEWKELGQFVAYERFGVPFFIALDQERRLHAFANSCRHRGMQVVSGKGKASTFVCPYHSWVYGLDGRLRRAPGMEKTYCFDNASYGLVELRLELWRGFVFVNLSQDCEPLSAQLGNLD